jgi:hypothetical protein
MCIHADMSETGHEILSPACGDLHSKDPLVPNPEACPQVIACDRGERKVQGMRVLAQQHGIAQVVILTEGLCCLYFPRVFCGKFWIIQQVMILLLSWMRPAFFQP